MRLNHLLVMTIVKKGDEKNCFLVKLVTKAY